MYSTLFQNENVMVLGDVMLDKYYFGNVDRISPEAPVPVVHVKKELEVAGGAANVANNIRQLSADPILISIVGSDQYGEHLKGILNALAIKNSLVKTKYPTITKLRVVGHQQQMLRLDFEKVQWIDSVVFNSIIEKIKLLAIHCKTIVISDYGKGFCSEELCKEVIRYGKAFEKPVMIDPKGHQWTKYANAWLVTPNLKEVGDAVGMIIENADAAVEQNARSLMDKYSIENLLVTRSEKGMSLFTPSETHHIPTEARQVFDVSGAGDTVIGTLAVSLAAGNSLADSCYLANKAAGIVVGKVGTVPISKQELLVELDPQKNSKLITTESLLNFVTLCRSLKKKIVLTNGIFDIIHRGHIALLREAKKLGDVLIVAVNSDTSAQRFLSSRFPINVELDRAEIIASIDCVDKVIVFDETTPVNLIRDIKPDILVKGGNITIDQVVGHEFAGKTVLIPHIKGYSTQAILETIASK